MKLKFKVSVNGEASRVKPSKKKFCIKVGKKMFEKKFEKKFLGKIFSKNVLTKKNVRIINYETKIFIIKLYSNIDKCHTIIALLAPFDKTGRKTGSIENVCGI